MRIRRVGEGALRRDGATGRFDVRFDDFPRGVFAAAAAARDRKIGLHLAQRLGAPIHGFPDLAIADGMAHADIHSSGLAGSRPHCSAGGNYKYKRE